MVRTEYRITGSLFHLEKRSFNKYTFVYNHEMEINIGYSCNSKDNYKINYVNARDKWMIKTLGPSTE